MHTKSLQLRPTRNNPMDCSPPGSSVHGILQARILLPFPTPGDLPNPGIEPSSLFLLHWQAVSLPLAPPGKPHFPGSSAVKNHLPMQDTGLIPRSGRSPGEGNGNALQYPCLENPMDRVAWWATVHGSQRADMTAHHT